MGVARRARGLLLIAFLAYVTVDLGCPLVPGAFTFDAADSVDAVSSYRAQPLALPRLPWVPPSLAVPPPADAAAPGAHAAHLAGVPAGWRPHAVRDRIAASDPPRSLDDD